MQIPRRPTPTRQSRCRHTQQLYSTTPAPRYRRTATPQLYGLEHAQAEVTGEPLPMSACAKSLQLCLTLCDPVDCSPPGSSVHGILQARILECVAFPFSRGSSRPRDRAHVSYVSCIAGGFFTSRATRETQQPIIHTLSAHPVRVLIRCNSLGGTVIFHIFTQPPTRSHGHGTSLHTHRIMESPGSSCRNQDNHTHSRPLELKPQA